jgi:branched-chain amino acid aminotransferase
MATSPALACPYVHLNGSLVSGERASISVLDHGLLYGDGLFETVRVTNGACFRAAAHLERLRESAAVLDLQLPVSLPELERGLHETAAANALGEGLLRLTVTRGVGSPIPDPAVCPTAGWFITARPSRLPDAAAFARGVRLCVGPAHPRLFVPGLKSLCYLPYQMARISARARGGDDAVLVFAGNAVETGISNLFAILDGVLTTPPLDSGCLPGITRALVLELARELGLPCREAPLPVARLPEASEVLVTNSGYGVMAATSLEDTSIGGGVPGPWGQALREAYLETLFRECPAAD